MGINDPLVASLTGRVECQAELVGIREALEPMEQELVVSIVYYIPTVPEEVKKEGVVTWVHDYTYMYMYFDSNAIAMCIFLVKANTYICRYMCIHCRYLYKGT